MTDRAANEDFAEFVRNKIRARVKDPVVAEKLAPKNHPFGSKRIPLETNYYEAYNQDNVLLVDINETPIERITPKGVKCSDKEYEFDVIIYATGFDAITGSITRIDIRGENGVSIKDKWANGPQTVLGLLAATMLARLLPGTGFFRTVLVLPWICAPLAIAVLWRWILAPTDGAVATVRGHSIEWLSDPSFALPLVSAVVVWMNVGYNSLSFLAGLLAIPNEIHAAARTDGANAWQRFWRITLPMLRPTMFFVLVTGIVSTAQVFDTVYALTDGGPGGSTDLVAHRIYAEAFGSAAIGRASVMAVVLFVILVGVTIMQHLYFRRRITYDLV